MNNFQTYIFLLHRFLLLFFCFGIVNVVHSFEKKSIHENGIVGNLYMKKSDSKKHAIIMLGGSEGGSGFDQSQHLITAATELDYCVLTLSYFDYNSTGMLPNKLKNIPLEYFNTAMTWLASQPTIKATEFSVVGVSRGAELALILATYYSKISTVVAISPSAYVWGAFNKGTFILGSAWSYNGKPVRCISNVRTRFYRPWWSIITKPDKVKKFVIPVENMSATLLLISGKYDYVWPSDTMANRIINRLDQSEYSFPYKHISYYGGHDILKKSARAILTFIKNNYPAKTTGNEVFQRP